MFIHNSNPVGRSLMEWSTARDPADFSYWVSEEPEPVKAGPQVPPEVWNETPVDADRCMSAIRDMCRAV